MYDTKAFRQERASWRAIIQLNVVRSVQVILDVIERAQNRRPSGQLPASPVVGEGLQALALKTRLSLRLRHVEEILMQRLVPGAKSGTAEYDHPAVVLHSLAEDMKALWKDETAQALLARENLRLQEGAGL